jgi:phage FluMu protein Com
MAETVSIRCRKCGSLASFTFDWWTVIHCMNCKTTRQFKRTHGLRKRLRSASILAARGK